MELNFRWRWNSRCSGAASLVLFIPLLKWYLTNSNFWNSRNQPLSLTAITTDMFRHRDILEPFISPINETAHTILAWYKIYIR
jgi:hypothetical protein